MTSDRENTQEMETADLELSGSDWHLNPTVSVPKGPTELKELLPIARTLSDSVVNAAFRSVEEKGKKISCKKGCGACCRQLVAISVAEAQELAQVVAAMPSDRQVVVRARFDQAVGRLEEAGLLDRNEPRGDRVPHVKNFGSREASLQELSHRYFSLQIACPFLEAESCSIYADRPLVCREYHVTSPAERCARLFEQPVDRVGVPVRLGDVVSRTVEKLNGPPGYSVPLVLALEWSEKHGESLERRYDGEQMLQVMMNEIHEAWDESLLRTTGSDPESSMAPVSEESTHPLLVTRLIDAGDNKTSETQTAKIEILDSEWQLQTTVSVPNGSMAVSELLPIAKTLADSVIEASVKSVEESGQKISCKKGCGACCRQLVPISGVEARHLLGLVDELPEPRRSEIRGRFAAARRRLEESGLLEKLRSRADWHSHEVGSLGLNYFAQGIPCPFLEDESCSIYADRPIACREYLVTSPAQNCARPSAQTIDQVNLPFKIWPALARLDGIAPSARFIPWVPLILALEWASNIPAENPERSGIELLSELFEHMSASKSALIQQAHEAPAGIPASISIPNQQRPADAVELTASSNPSPVRQSEEGLASPEFPLYIGSAKDFARAQAIFRIARFDEASICRIFEIGDMSDIGSVNRHKVHVAGILGLLLRLFLFIDTVPRAEVESVIDSVTLGSLQALDLIRLDMFGDDKEQMEKYYCPVWLYPVGDFLVASDRGKNPDGSTLVRMPDIVFPAIYEGTLRFLRVISKSRVGDALDLCSGSGIAALVLSRSASRAVACDITARAGHFAQFNRLLNGCANVEVVQGDLYGAVNDRTFDRIVAHPPFVPASTEALIYRDSGQTGERLIKRIIEGVPCYLRRGGTFYMVCSAWDTKEGLFEERARGWLGERRDEFDIIFALHREEPPEQIARQLPEIRESGDASAIIRWSGQFREAGFEKNVYGAIVIHRKNIARDSYEIVRPITKRLRLGELTDGSCLEWALRWYAWRRRREADGDLIQMVSQIRPRLSSNLEVKVTHAVHGGSLVPTDSVLQSKRPFPTASRVDPWMLQILAHFDGKCTTEEVYNNAHGAVAIPESFQLEDFVTLVVNMIERGHFEVDESLLES